VVDVSCVVHVHTTYSDGTATVTELVTAAAAAGVDALLVTDHDTLGAVRDGWQGRREGVCVLIGTEVSPKGGHYIVYGARKTTTVR
jgi:predicted metal-dependent phosphoesterase TrpH